MIAHRATGLLAWGAIALLLIVPYALYKPVAAHVGAPLLYGACLIILALALSGLKSGKSPRQVVQSLSLTNYLHCSALVAAAYAWGWLTVHIFGLGRHFFGAVVVAVPALALLATAGNIAFRGLYVDVGLSAPDPRKAGKERKQQKVMAKKEKRKARKQADEGAA